MRQMGSPWRPRAGQGAVRLPFPESSQSSGGGTMHTVTEPAPEETGGRGHRAQ